MAAGTERLFFSEPYSRFITTEPCSSSLRESSEGGYGSPKEKNVHRL